MTERSLLRNTVYNSLGKLWLLLIGFILTPYIVRSVGVELFGLWAVISIMIGTFGLFDLGVRTSFIKYISHYHAIGDADGVNEIVNTGFVYYLLFGLVIGAAAGVCRAPLFRLFKLSPGLAAEAALAYHAVIAAFVIECALRSYGAAIEGTQRYDVKTRLEIVMSLCYAAAIVVLLSSGYGFRGLVWASVGRTMAESALALCLGFILLPEMVFRPALASARRFRQMFSFGFTLQVARWAEEIIFHMDKLIVGAFLSVGMVTFYQLGTSLSNRLRLLPSMFITPLFPYTSNLSALGEHAQIYRVYVRSTRYMFLLALPAFAFLALRADAVMEGWMGPGFERAAQVMRVLAGSYCLNCVMGAAVAVAQGIGAVRLIMVSCLLVSAANLISSIAFVWLCGFIGVALGTALSLGAASIFFWAWFHRVIKRPFWATLAPIAAKPLLATALGVAGLSIAHRLIPQLRQASGRLDILLVLAGEFAVMVALYGLALALLRYFDDEDLELLRQLTGSINFRGRAR
ncbi:MAG: oligosaccharide flippase family protein [Candidatus Aureabacteria bacterium]|nr:oligosaccharide flippase family protein [Candidatus Auribacterota bacterium]